MIREAEKNVSKKTEKADQILLEQSVDSINIQDIWNMTTYVYM